MKDTYIPAPEVDAEILVPYARKINLVAKVKELFAML